MCLDYEPNMNGLGPSSKQSYKLCWIFRPCSMIADEVGNKDDKVGDKDDEVMRTF